MMHCPSVGLVILVALTCVKFIWSKDASRVRSQTCQSEVRPAWLLENKELDVCGCVMEVMETYQTFVFLQHHSCKVRQTRCMWGKCVRHVVFMPPKFYGQATHAADSARVFDFWSRPDRPTWCQKRGHHLAQKVKRKPNYLCRRRTRKGATKLYGCRYLTEQSLAMKALLLMFVLVHLCCFHC